MNYWVSRGGQQYGPYSLVDLQRYVASGNIMATDLARSESMSQWLPVSQILSGGGDPAQPAAAELPQPPAPAQSAAAPQSYGVQPIYSQPPGAMAAAPAQYAVVPGAMDYAQWGNRALGAIIDSLLVAVAMVVLYFVFTSLTLVASTASHGLGSGMCCLYVALMPVATLLAGLYNKVYLVSQRGYSIGQGMMKLKVVDANGNLLSQGTALIRLLAQAGLSLIPLAGIIDLLWPLWDERRQTLHDKAVSCYVINNPSGV